MDETEKDWNRLEKDARLKMRTNGTALTARGLDQVEAYRKARAALTEDEKDGLLRANYFAACPICGVGGDHLCNWKSDWLVCHIHKLKWAWGYNMSCAWMDMTTHELIDEHDLLAEYVSVKPWMPDWEPKPQHPLHDPIADDSHSDEIIADMRANPDNWAEWNARAWRHSC